MYKYNDIYYGHICTQKANQYREIFTALYFAIDFTTAYLDTAYSS